MFEQADHAWRSGLFAQQQKKKTTNSQFEEDGFFKAYKKRAWKMHEKESELLTEEERIQRMAEDIEDQANNRGNKFSRRRMFIEEKSVDYINERNRKFNEKLERNYSKYASEIKGNLERGTAL